MFAKTFTIQIRLSEIDNLSIEERKGYLTLVLVTSRDSRLLLRKTEGIRDWQKSIETQLSQERQRHREMQSTNDFWNRKQFSDCHNTAAASQWLLVRENIGKTPSLALDHFLNSRYCRSHVRLPEQNVSEQLPL